MTIKSITVKCPCGEGHELETIFRFLNGFGLPVICSDCGRAVDLTLYHIVQESVSRMESGHGCPDSN